MRMLAPAKLNLRLRVLGRRDDGYHSIETLFLRLALADELRLEAGAKGIRLDVEPGGEGSAAATAAVPPGEENICWRAAESLYREVGLAPAVHIRLRKRIPASAGLGGGSSDAAAVLVGLNRALGSPLPPGDLLGLAGRLGSDVPFFASGAEFALARGRGERLVPLAPPPPRPVLVLVPDFGVSAADAYRWWSEEGGVEGVPAGPPAEALPAAARLAAWDVLKGLAGNDLAPAVERRHAELAAAREALEATGAEIALLCGSGSCVAGIFPGEAERDAARRAILGGPAWPGGWSFIDTRTGSPAPAGGRPSNSG